MVTNKHFKRTILTVMGLTLGLMTLSFLEVAAQTPSPNNGQAEKARLPRKQANDWLKGLISAHGGDWEKGRYRFVVGLSTGQFGRDPAQAIVMRRLLYSWLNNSLTEGDRFVPFAWEMNVWQTGKEVSLKDDTASREAIIDQIAHAPRADSEGGHDVERALFDAMTTLMPLKSAPSTILILLTNTNQSQSPTGKQTSLFGGNNPRLIEAAKRNRMRLPPQRASFSCATPSGGTLTVDATALVPDRLESLPNVSGASRLSAYPLEEWRPQEDRPASANELPNPPVKAKSLPSPTQTETERKPGGFSFLWLVLALLGVLALIAALSMRAKKANPPTVDATKASSSTVGKTIPGKIELKIGTPSRLETLSPLPAEGEWILTQSGKIVPVQTPNKNPKAEKTEDIEDTTLAVLMITPQRELMMKAQPEVQFMDIKGAEDELRNSSSVLYVKPGGSRPLLRVRFRDNPPLRLEIGYGKDR